MDEKSVSVISTDSIKRTAKVTHGWVTSKTSPVCMTFQAKPDAREGHNW